MDVKRGYYWVYRFKNDQCPVIAYFGKGGGWQFGGVIQSHKLIRQVGHTHPEQVCYRIEDYKSELDE